MQPSLSTVSHTYKEMLKRSAYPNKRAYEEQFGYHQVEVYQKAFSDRQSDWRICGLFPKGERFVEKTCVDTYELHLVVTSPKVITYNRYSPFRIVIQEDDDIHTLADILKAFTGCVPEQTTLKGMYLYIHQMMCAWKEQDEWYAMQDKGQAREQLSTFKRMMIHRYKHGLRKREHLLPTSIWKDYVTEEEEEGIKECRKVLLGKSYLTSMDGFEGFSQNEKEFIAFEQSIQKEFERIDREKKERVKKKVKIDSVFPYPLSAQYV